MLELDMIRWMDVRFVGLALLGAVVCSCASAPHLSTADSHRAFVADAPTAIRLARLAWIKAHPEMADEIASEAEWQAHEIAKLDYGVWTVWEPVPENSIGGSIYILLSQADGHLIRMYFIQ